MMLIYGDFKGIRPQNQWIMSTQFIENSFHANAEIIMYLRQLLSTSVIVN